MEFTVFWNLKKYDHLSSTLDFCVQQPSVPPTPARTNTYHSMPEGRGRSAIGIK